VIKFSSLCDPGVSRLLKNSMFTRHFVEIDEGLYSGRKNGGRFGGPPGCSSGGTTCCSEIALLIRDHVQGKAGPQQPIRKRHNAGFPVEPRSLSDSPTPSLKPRVNRRGGARCDCSQVQLPASLVPLCWGENRDLAPTATHKQHIGCQHSSVRNCSNTNQQGGIGVCSRRWKESRNDANASRRAS